MPPGKPKVGLNSRFGMDVKNKNGISRIKLSPREILELRARQKKR